jgi:hypothetical protein
LINTLEIMAASGAQHGAGSFSWRGCTLASRAAAGDNRLRLQKVHILA